MNSGTIEKLIGPDGRPAEDPELLQPLNHFWSSKPRRLYQEIVPAFNYWLKVREEKVEKIIYICETLLAPLYLHDDIEDNCELRHGDPTAHVVFGIPLTLNCANYALSIVLEHVLALDHPQAMPIVVQELREYFRATGKDIYNRETSNCPTEAEYLRDYYAISSITFDLPVRLLKLFSDDDERNLDKLIKPVALYTIILSDYMNLKSDKLGKRKTHCQDLSEGKFNFPIVHAINANHPDSAQVATILKKRTRDEDLKRHCVSLMENIGTFAYTREVLEKLREEIQAELRVLGGNPLIEAFMVEIKFIIEVF